MKTQSSRGKFLRKDIDEVIIATGEQGDKGITRFVGRYNKR